MTIREQLRAIRRECQTMPPPEHDAPTSDHLGFIFCRVLGFMLSPVYWMLVLAAAVLAQVVVG